jgi:hypothetical protein
MENPMLPSIGLGSVEMQTLRVALADWTDFDASAHMLAQCLGIMPLQQEMKQATRKGLRHGRSAFD